MVSLFCGISKIKLIYIAKEKHTDIENKLVVNSGEKERREGL